MARAFIGVGSNVEPERSVQESLRLLGSLARITGISTVYSTAPVGTKGGGRFYNCVVSVDTGLEPFALREALRSIEESLGRKRCEDRYAPRPIDLDIVIYGDVETDERGLKLPDPDIFTRAFLALPLRELSPGLVVPGTDKKIEDIAGRLDCQGMDALKGYTERLRKEFLVAGC